MRSHDRDRVVHRLRRTCKWKRQVRTTERISVVALLRDRIFVMSNLAYHVQFSVVIFLYASWRSRGRVRALDKRLASE